MSAPTNTESLILMMKIGSTLLTIYLDEKGTGIKQPQINCDGYITYVMQHW